MNPLSYVLLLKVVKDLKIRVGALGLIMLKDGIYAYVGSSRNWLQERLSRHFRREKRVRWHIDYLTTNPLIYPLSSLILCIDEQKLAQKLSRFFIYVKGFGTSDDLKNPSHLFYLGRGNEKKIIRKIYSLINY